MYVVSLTHHRSTRFSLVESGVVGLVVVVLLGEFLAVYMQHGHVTYSISKNPR